MRLPFLVATFMVGALLGVGAQPAPVAAASPPKVAVIVGPVGGSTAGYIRDAEAAAAEALKYTPNVVKVYTPNATWAAAKAAMQDASIVIYMGHGNGFPSPYSATLAMDRQNGLGVNPTAGGDDSATKYYGEQFLRNEVRLAPNAVVILGHLCYASGTSEPGKARSDRSPGQGAGRQLRRRVPRHRRARRHRRGLRLVARRLRPGAVHDQPDRPEHVADLAHRARAMPSPSRARARRA